MTSSQQGQSLAEIYFEHVRQPAADWLVLSFCLKMYFPFAAASPRLKTRNDKYGNLAFQSMNAACSDPASNSDQGYLWQIVVHRSCSDLSACKCLIT